LGGRPKNSFITVHDNGLTVVGVLVIDAEAPHKPLVESIRGQFSDFVGGDLGRFSPFVVKQVNPANNRSICVFVHLLNLAVRIQLQREAPAFGPEVWSTKDVIFRVFFKSLARPLISTFRDDFLDRIQRQYKDCLAVPLEGIIRKAPLYGPFFEFAPTDVARDAARARGKALLFPPYLGFFSIIGFKHGGGTKKAVHAPYTAAVEALREDGRVEAYVSTGVFGTNQFILVHTKDPESDKQRLLEVLRRGYEGYPITIISMNNLRTEHDLYHAVNQITYTAACSNTDIHTMFKARGSVHERLLRETLKRAGRDVRVSRPGAAAGSMGRLDSAEARATDAGGRPTGSTDRPDSAGGCSTGSTDRPDSAGGCSTGSSMDRLNSAEQREAGMLRRDARMSVAGLISVPRPVVPSFANVVSFIGDFSAGGGFPQRDKTPDHPLVKPHRKSVPGTIIVNLPEVRRGLSRPFVPGAASFPPRAPATAGPASVPGAASVPPRAPATAGPASVPPPAQSRLADFNFPAAAMGHAPSLPPRSSISLPPAPAQQRLADFNFPAAAMGHAPSLPPRSSISLPSAPAQQRSVDFSAVAGVAAGE
jgi:hypothetical protein